MVYYSEDNLLIRAIENADAERFYEAFLNQGWNKPILQFLRYAEEHKQGRRLVFVAELDGQVAGYVTLKPRATYGAFMERNLPEICDFNVLKAYRRQGIGSKLMDIAEEHAFETSDTVTLGVGLHSGYGSAQRMYAKRGYVPDGSGVWYGDTNLPEGADCKADDDLVLYLSKERV